MAQPTAKTTRADRLIGPLAIAWIVSYFAARLGLEAQLAMPLRVALALLPIPFFVAFLVAAWRSIETGDELYRRMHLEALAFAFPMTITLIMVLGLFELATGLNKDDFSYRHTWQIVFMFWLFGWVRAVRRYQ
jgi:hypothetical protein